MRPRFPASTFVAPKFIAEVSSNHHQDLDRCFEFIDVAAQIGCDAVKFQLFKIEELFAPEILDKSENHRSRKQWELPVSFLPELKKRCLEKRIEFSCTPFYIEAVKELRPYVDFFKIASYELLWDDLLIACAQTGKPVVLSTGMANLEEIAHAAKILSSNGCQKPTLLHCVSAYPTKAEEANLSSIESIRSVSGCDVGWSDHTVNPGVIHRAIHKWGANTIEFHLDLDEKGGEYGAGHCWLPHQIAAVIRDVRDGFSADGEEGKPLAPGEENDRKWRADPEDGLRPLKFVRENWRPKIA